MNNHPTMIEASEDSRFRFTMKDAQGNEYPAVLEIDAAGKKRPIAIDLSDLNPTVRMMLER